MPPLRASTVLIGLAVPISVALDNLLLAVIALGVLFNARAVWQIATRHPVARAAWLLFIALFVAMFHGATPLREAAGTLGKYADLAFIPLFMLMLSDDVSRRRAQYAFLSAMGLTLLLSYLVGLKFLPVQHWMNALAAANNPVIFHSHITQNNMMAFAVFLALLNLREAFSLRQDCPKGERLVEPLANRLGWQTTPAKSLVMAAYCLRVHGAQLAWGLFAVAAGINVLFMVQGRTGYAILLVLMVWFAGTTLARYRRKRGRAWGWRQGMAGMLVLGGMVAATYFASPRLHDRVGSVAAEYQAWQPNHGKDTSTGQRLDFYYNALQIAQQHLLFGVGTGGFPAAFARQVQGSDALPTHNPHNEYLMITVQCGLVGLALLLYLFYTQWRYAPLLDTPFEQDAARGLVLAYMVNCLVNSALLDHSDGLFFAFMTAVLFANLKMARHG